jgi:hypothetical protein
MFFEIMELAWEGNIAKILTIFEKIDEAKSQMVI